MKARKQQPCSALQAYLFSIWMFCLVLFQHILLRGGHDSWTVVGAQDHRPVFRRGGQVGAKNAGLRIERLRQPGTYFRFVHPMFSQNRDCHCWLLLRRLGFQNEFDLWIILLNSFESGFLQVRLEVIFTTSFLVVIKRNVRGFLQAKFACACRRKTISVSWRLKQIEHMRHTRASISRVSVRELSFGLYRLVFFGYRDSSQD